MSVASSRPWPGVPGLLVFSLWLSVGACPFDPVLPGEEGRPCSESGTCLASYVCDEGTCRRSRLGEPCDLANDRCAEGFCWSTGAGSPFCTAACASSSQCPGRSRCAEGSPTLPGAFVCVPEEQVEGGSVGLLGPGDGCTTSQECQSGICNTGTCTDTCQHQRQCENTATFECRVVDVGGRTSTRCATPRTGGTQGAVCNATSECQLGPCVDTGAGGGGICTEPCCSTADCPGGTSCWFVTWTGWTPEDGLARTCVPRASTGSASLGEACAGDFDCSSELCWLDPNTQIRACSDLCCTNADCPQNYHCAPQTIDLDETSGEDSYVPICVTNG